MASVSIAAVSLPCANLRSQFLNGQSLRASFEVKPASARCRDLRVSAAWTKVSTKADLEKNGGRIVAVVNDQKILIQQYQGQVYAVSNKCSHLGLPLQGRIMSAEVTPEGCVVCGAHKTAFDLKTGEVKGEWCPGGFPLHPPRIHHAQTVHPTFHHSPVFPSSRTSHAVTQTRASLYFR
eukprot:jgi/Mesvir1/3649/Mv14944-RA.1